MLKIGKNINLLKILFQENIKETICSNDIINFKE